MPYRKDSLASAIMHAFVFHSTSLAINLGVPKANLCVPVSLIALVELGASDVQVLSLVDLDYVFMLQTRTEDYCPTKLGI